MDKPVFLRGVDEEIREVVTRVARAGASPAIPADRRALVF